MLTLRLIRVVFSLAVLASTTLAAQDTLLDEARQAFQRAERLAAELESQPTSERPRADFDRVVRAYRRVYFITPHTGYADDALEREAHWLEEAGDPERAIRRLRFLIRGYPASPHLKAARANLERLKRPPPAEETGAAHVRVKNIRYWESTHYVPGRRRSQR